MMNIFENVILPTVACIGACFFILFFKYLKDYLDAKFTKIENDEIKKKIETVKEFSISGDDVMELMLNNVSELREYYGVVSFK